MRTLNISQVATIVELAKAKPTVAKAKAYKIVAACDASLKAHNVGELALEPGVRLPLKAVVDFIWAVRKHFVGLTRTAKVAAAA